MVKRSANTKLEIDGAVSLYKQVEKQILQCLAAGEWKPGEQLPTEPQLAARMGVAVFTIRAGISELVAANILVRKQGKGTFVARHTRQRQRYQFSHVFRHDGTQLLADRELLSFGKAVATNHVAQVLGLPGGERQNVLHMNFLLSVDREPAATMEIMVPAGMFAGVSSNGIRKSSDNLYAVYQDTCNINVIRVEESVYAALARAPIARSLKIPAGHPVLRIERIAYTYNDVPVEFRVRHLDAEKYHYRSDEGGI
jgi:GntR family transcriptional regulator